MFNNEEWKDIEEFEGLYQVSNLGRVKSLVYGKERIMKPSKNENGYIKINLNHNNYVKCYKVHRLVAKAFIPNPDNLPQVNHKDEDKTNNNVDNLEWCTNAYNSNYGTINKRRSSKLAKKVMCIETGKVFNSQGEASKEMNINQRSISKCCTGKLKSSHKFHFCECLA